MSNERLVYYRLFGMYKNDRNAHNYSKRDDNRPDLKTVEQS